VSNIKLKQRKNAIGECLDYQIPVTHPKGTNRGEEIYKQQSEIG